MSPLFTVILAILLILAVVDLIVGVSNDAINFLNSSLGSRVAPYRVILGVAAVGILVGVLTSHGMMEVARTGVFHPEQFTFSNVMILYAGVMLTDVVLLNGFNKLGLPTSTTVSMIFELLGAAVAVSLFKINADGNLTLGDLGNMVNGGKALGMISAILVSVVLSFVAGSLLMYVSRLLFTFRYKRQFARWGAAWCGVAIVGILYFAVFKGLKSSGLITDEFNSLVKTHMGAVLLGAWVVATALLWILQRCKVSILKITILSGTFALALAFAGNDLVNFIGVPLAGLDAYKLALQSGDMNMLMGGLADGGMVNTWYLLIAGVVMAVTLFLSKDAQRVSQTELTLSSQHDEDERFSSTAFSRALVRWSVGVNKWWHRTLPDRWIDDINRRFIPLPEEERRGSNYDKIRAVVNLAASSILICIGTSFKLPLSTTYVVFMVAMGSSLADRAWGRESAVYRISGVAAVILGWFVTAFIAFVASLLITTLLLWGGGWALAVLVVLCAWALLSRMGHKDEDKDNAADGTGTRSPLVKRNDQPSDTLQRCTAMVCSTMEQIGQVYNRMLVSLFTENRKPLKEAMEQSERMYHEADARKYGIIHTLKTLEAQGVETASYYVQVVDYLSEVTKALLHCTRPAYEHINNNHRGLTGPQITDLKRVNDQVDDIFKTIDEMLKKHDYSKLDEVMHKRDACFDLIEEVMKRNIKRLQQDPTGSTRAGALFFNLLGETKNMVLQSRNLIKSQAHLWPVNDPAAGDPKAGEAQP